MAPPEIWKMPQLRHVEFTELHLPDPPSDDPDADIVLENLHMLSRIRDFKCGEEVVKRIPNIKELGIIYGDCEEEPILSLNNLGRLHNLETLDFQFINVNRRLHLLRNSITFPHSLKRLTLQGTKLQWEDLTAKIGSLPLLEDLNLCDNAFIGPHWETVEGQFCSLKRLTIIDASDLEYWTTDATHFPRLEHLVFYGLRKLKEIPLSIGDIPTLQLIKLYLCSDSAADSAERIREEQEELGNEGLQVKVMRM